MTRRSFFQVILSSFAAAAVAVAPEPFLFPANEWFKIRLDVGEQSTDLYLTEPAPEGGLNKTLIASGHYPPQPDSLPFQLECELRFPESKTAFQVVEHMVEIFRVKVDSRGRHFVYVSPAAARTGREWWGDNFLVRDDVATMFMGTAQDYSKKRAIHTSFEI